MKKKLTVVIIVVLLLIIGTASAAISFAVWDNRTDDTIIDIVTGDQKNISIDELAFKEDKVLRPNSPLNSSKHSNIVTVMKFKINIQEFDCASYSFGNLMMTIDKDTTIDASAFMKTYLYQDGKELPADARLLNGGVYEIKVGFIVDADSDLLSTNMQGKPLSVDFNLSGEKASA